MKKQFQNYTSKNGHERIWACIILNWKKFDSITSELIALHWLPAAQHIKFKVLLLVFKAHHKHSSTYNIVWTDLGNKLSADSSEHLLLPFIIWHLKPVLLSQVHLFLVSALKSATLFQITSKVLSPLVLAGNLKLIWLKKHIAIYHCTLTILWALWTNAVETSTLQMPLTDWLIDW